MEEYQHYLMTVRSNNNNTTVKYLRNLSKVVNLAKTRGLIQTNPIDLLPLKMQTVEREFLTQDELKRLEEKQIGISAFGTGSGYFSVLLSDRIGLCRCGVSQHGKYRRG